MNHERKFIANDVPGQGMRPCTSSTRVGFTQVLSLNTDKLFKHGGFSIRGKFILVLIISAALCILAFGLPNGGTSDETWITSLCGSQGIVGNWSWIHNEYVIANPDGSLLVYNIGSPSYLYDTGSWTLSDASKQIYTLTWTKGAIDNLTLSPDCNSLDGYNNANEHVIGTRNFKKAACDRLILDLNEGPGSVVIAKVVDACEHKPLKDVDLDIRIFHTWDEQLKKAINGQFVDIDPMQTDENGEAPIQVTGHLGQPTAKRGGIYRVDVYASKENYDTSDRSIHVTIGQGATSPVAILRASSWIVSETGPQGDYYGTWTRRPGTNTFDASWSGGSIRDVIDITSVEGNTITLHRRENNGDYIGTISPDGRSFSGTGSWYDTGEELYASIGGAL
jgi:hypothetical protein